MRLFEPIFRNVINKVKKVIINDLNKAATDYGINLIDNTIKKYKIESAVTNVRVQDYNSNEKYDVIEAVYYMQHLNSYQECCTIL